MSLFADVLRIVNAIRETEPDAIVFDAVSDDQIVLLTSRRIDATARHASDAGEAPVGVARVSPMRDNIIEAWHFVAGPPPHLRDDRPVVVGETLRHDGRLVLCELGLHASERALDALDYAPGPWICRVEVGDEILHDTDKLVARERTVLWLFDATAVLCAFARECALSVAHLWEMPVVVRRYLETGDETIRAAAGAVAWAAAWDAARDAARPAAGAAAWAVARAAARDAAGAAAWDAVRDEQNIMAARDAAWAAARDAARDEQNIMLESLLREHEAAS